MGELDEEKERKKPNSSDSSVPTGNALAADVDVSHDESMAINRDISITSGATGPHSDRMTVADARTEDRETAPSVEVGPLSTFSYLLLDTSSLFALLCEYGHPAVFVSGQSVCCKPRITLVQHTC